MLRRGTVTRICRIPMVCTDPMSGYAKFGFGCCPSAQLGAPASRLPCWTEDTLGRSDANYCWLRMTAVTAFELLRDSPFSTAFAGSKG
jgi:hypothetical protein